MVQDYVPARANLSKGLIVKSHILERNKYERHEPQADTTNNYSESIDLLTVSGTDPDEIPWSTANNTYSQFTIEPLSNHTGSDNVYGPIAISNTYSWEKYTGEFGGSTLDVVTGTFSQYETSSMTNNGPYYIVNCNRFLITLPGGHSYTGSYVDCNGYLQQISESPFGTDILDFCSFNTEIDITKDPLGFPTGLAFYPSGPCATSYEIPSITYNDGATYNNINNAVTSTRFTEAEYTYGIDVPVNMANIISQSTCQSCNRINCMQYSYTNTSATDIHGFSYQDCNNIVHNVALNPGQSITICAKQNSDNSYETPAFGSLTRSSGIICGAAFSNFPYVSNCKDAGITNVSTSSFDISYIDCTGSLHIKTIGASTGVSLGCLDPDSINIGGFGAPPYPSDYELIIGDLCIDPYTLSSYTKYCQFLSNISTGPLTNYTYQYITCDGIQESGSGYCSAPFGGCNIDLGKCIRSGSLVITGDAGGVILTGSIGYCGYYEDPTPYTGSRTPVEIQEYNYNRTSTVNSRYAGAKSTSAKYNVYTEGDDSYPGYAAIDNYVHYTGLFTTVESSSYFPDQMLSLIHI